MPPLEESLSKYINSIGHLVTQSELCNTKKVILLLFKVTLRNKEFNIEILRLDC